MGNHNGDEDSHTIPPFPPPPFLPPKPIANKKSYKVDDMSKSDERRLRGLTHSMEKQMKHDREHDRDHDRNYDRSRERESSEQNGNYEPIWQYKLQHPMSGEPSSSSGHEHGQSGQDPHFMPYPDEFLKDNQNATNKTALYLGIFIPVFIAILLLSCGFYWYRRRRLRKFKKRALAAKEISIIGNHYLDSENLKPKKPADPWEIKRENVVVHYERKLGSGAFADVYVGEVIGDTGIKKVYNDVLMLSNFHDCEVAVKMLPPFADETSKNDFQKEINFMKSLKYHPHLLCLMGYSPDASPLLLIEYCAHGDLLHFVRDHKNQLVHGNEAQNNLKVKNLVSFSWQISNGLEYLSSIGIVHRDVAARNVLLDKNNVCKIGDFGLCRIADSQIYTTRGGKLPVRWMSIESLRSFEFSMKTDVWSYGILLFELFSFGEVPYAGLENSEILEYLESSKRLNKPAYCTEDIYEIMLNSWQFFPSDRRSFAEICLQLMRILENANSDYGYVEAIDGNEIKAIDSVDDTGQSVV